MQVRRPPPSLLRNRVTDLVVLSLQVTVAAQCVGVAGMLWWRRLTVDEVLAAAGVPLPGVTAGLGLAAGLLLVLAAAVLLRPGRGVLLCVGGWQVGLVLVHVWASGLAGGWLTPFAQAVRYLGPVALLLLAMPVRAATSAGGTGTAVLLLRGAAAATFAAHGLEALMITPHFVDLIDAAAALLGFTVPAPVSALILRVIGGVDLLLAGLVLTRRWRWVAAYMAFWGWLAACSRIIHFGPVGVTEALLRFANGGVPLALLLYWHGTRHAAVPEGTGDGHAQALPPEIRPALRVEA